MATTTPINQLRKAFYEAKLGITGNYQDLRHRYFKQQLGL